MKRIISICITVLFLCGCTPQTPAADIAATTLPVYEFTVRLCEGTPLTVTQLVTEEVSCLHDYSLNVNQVKAAEAANTIVISGAGLEDFMADILSDKICVDASQGVELLCPENSHSHTEHDHHHESDPHIWLSPRYARQMADNICTGLCEQYPDYSSVFTANLEILFTELDQLQVYGEQALSSLICREMITFHDGFAYFADAFDLTILEAVEEESGSEASAQELIHLI